MDDENLYYLWEKMENYINPKEKKQAIEEFLMCVYDNGGDIYKLLETSDDTGDEVFSKVAKRFIKENSIEKESW